MSWRREGKGTCGKRQVIEEQEKEDIPYLPVVLIVETVRQQPLLVAVWKQTPFDDCQFLYT